MSGSVRKRLQSAHTYDALVMLATTSDNAELIEHLAQIDKDLPRTFPGTLVQRNVCADHTCMSNDLSPDVRQKTRSFARARKPCWGSMRVMEVTEHFSNLSVEYCPRTACAIRVWDTARP